MVFSDIKASFVIVMKNRHFGTMGRILVNHKATGKPRITKYSPSNQYR